MKGWMIWPFLGLPATAWAEKTFQQQVDVIRSRQGTIDQALTQYGHSLGFDVGQTGVEPRPEKPRSLFQVHSSLMTSQIPQGKLLFGKLVNRLVVGTDGSPVLIEFDPGQGFISGLRAMGMARHAGTQGRVSLELARLLLRGGHAVAFQGTALDPDGAYGMAAQVFSGKAWAVAGAMASSFIAGLASAQQTQTATPLGFSQVQPTGRNSILQGVAQTAADQSKRLIEESTAEKPVLVVDALTPVTVLIQEEVRW